MAIMVTMAIIMAIITVCGLSVYFFPVLTFL
jgi:hypothetical protein